LLARLSRACTCPAYLILIIVTISGEDYKLWSSSVWGTVSLFSRGRETTTMNLSQSSGRELSSGLPDYGTRVSPIRLRRSVWNSIICCGSLYGAVTSSDHLASIIGWFMNWKEIGRKQSWPHRGIIPAVHWKDWEEPRSASVRIAEIWTEQLPNTSLHQFARFEIT
jgi:hypothetical protein